MKKIISFMLALFMLLSVCACGAAPEQSGTSVPAGTPEAGPEPEYTPGLPQEESGAAEQPKEDDGREQLRFAADYEELFEELLLRMESVNLREITDEAVVAETSEEPAAFNGSYYGTNVQVEGIDEGDIVKTDGEYIYIIESYEGSRLIILKAAGAATEPVSITELDLRSLSGTPLKNEANVSREDRSCEEMFVFGDCLAVIYSLWSYREWEEDRVWQHESSTVTKIEFYDISDPARPVLRETLAQDGSLQSTRLHDGRLYVITSWENYSTRRREEIEMRELIPALYDGETRNCIPAKDICICPHNSNCNYLVTAVYDMEQARVLDSGSILGGGGEVYMSGENLYLLARSWSDGAGEPRSEGVYTVVDYAPCASTAVYRFSLGEDGLELEAEGLVPGYMDSRFSADEYGGFLRLVTTVHSSSYSVYTDEEKDFVNVVHHGEETQTSGLYILDGALNIVGCVKDLAEGENVYSARFDGDMAYFCTFELVDPLFAVDCSDPEEPVVLSALKISGFSEYLHQWDENRLFGFGCEADETSGISSGLKLVMFDSSRKADVRVENSLHMEHVMWSEALYDPHAMFICPEKNIIGFVADGSYYIYGYSPETGFFQRGKLDFHGREYGSRGLYIGEEIYIIGRDGGYVLDMESCEEIAVLYW